MGSWIEEMRADQAGFWEARYSSGSPASSGRPGEMLRRFVEPLAPGRALELGCGKGDDAVWLAGQGWTVTAVEISQTALDYAAANAAKAGVADRIAFERHDLTQTFPEGLYDLIAASFLAAHPREAVFQRAAQAVARGGHLLIVDHGSRAPWSWSDEDAQFPTAEETLASLLVNEGDWERVQVGGMERIANGPDGQTATVLDNVTLLRRVGNAG
ncbi:bifunctional 2-polyprenyl-6-hydroxyphenol methylase/3-demethylubiquinol 3-O-methyltransferase UbiG [Pseudoruegeria sp. HB172150]|uniref:class I SAM-dependent methyltransferase n=1 Tax=Pseudoruegeria sp. HB172150 TaxID=2721164 RepID=UPI0020A685CA|nr:methyltransferase domain-containing protein [Pseudoruegeria sp. HB172150]